MQINTAFRSTKEGKLGYRGEQLTDLVAVFQWDYLSTVSHLLEASWELTVFYIWVFERWNTVDIHNLISFKLWKSGKQPEWIYISPVTESLEEETRNETATPQCSQGCSQLLTWSSFRWSHSGYFTTIWSGRKKTCLDLTSASAFGLFQYHLSLAAGKLHCIYLRI